MKMPGRVERPGRGTGWGSGSSAGTAPADLADWDCSPLSGDRGRSQQHGEVFVQLPACWKSHKKASPIFLCEKRLLDPGKYRHAIFPKQPTATF